jgi:predicted dehydrogenase
MVGQTPGPLRVGLIGCGNISDTYCRNARLFADFTIVGCADLNPAAAAARGAAHGLPVCTPAAMLRRDDVDCILNLTVPAAHAEVSLAAIAAGKHVYSEKPLATTVADGQATIDAAASAGVRVGVAPDTVLGAGVQTARRLLDGGFAGRIVSGVAAYMSRGMEHWHPNPAFFFHADAGPALDMGPYYVTALLSLLGPVTRVQATGRMARRERRVTAAGPLSGTMIPVETFTTLQALLTFASGADIVLLTSWDVPRHGLRPIELYGTEASVRLPDPNFFGGPVETATAERDWQAAATDGMVFGRPNMASPRGDFADYRGLGLADMAAAIAAGRPHRASGALGLHALAVMRGMVEAAAEGRAVEIGVPMERPAAFPEAEAAQRLATAPDRG